MSRYITRPWIGSNANQASELMIIQKILLLLSAAAAITWLALGLHSARLQAAGVERFHAGEELSPQKIGEIAQLFRAARASNPDTLPYLAEAYLYISTGSPSNAISLLQTVVRREPDNYFAWKLLTSAAAEEDPELAEQAERRLREIGPRGNPEG